MARTAHYVASTHWDREWYEPYQGFRMRLVSMLDEVFATLDSDPAFTSFVMDGQVIPIFDYLEIKPENRKKVESYVRKGRLKLGPWYVLPDEWLVSGESLVRNLQTGIEMAGEFGAPSSRAGFLCDMFGHVGQMPQIFNQMNIPVSFVWRGTLEKDSPGHFNWKAPDGTITPAYRFGKTGYCTYAYAVRDPFSDEPLDLEKAVESMVEFAVIQSRRIKTGPILIFDGGDHLEIEPQTSALITQANKQLEPHGITVVHSTLDNYIKDFLKERGNIQKTLVGELRESGRDPVSIDEQWLIPGVLSSRIHLKQLNALCEDELCLWAEPFSTFAGAIGMEYPVGYIRTAWRHLLENHPHDSICGCSIDQVHKDMEFRFDQSLGISSRLTSQVLRAVAIAAAPPEMHDDSFMLAVFNATAADIDEPVDIDIPLPLNWPQRFQEFFGFEEKFSFKLVDARRKDIPYQLTGQRRDSKGFRRQRYKFPKKDNRHIVSVTVSLKVPSFGYTTVMVVPVEGPTRYPGSMAAAHNVIENEALTVKAESNGTITITDKRTDKTYEQLLTFEDSADIGDGWYHGVAVNDRVYLSTACSADVAVVDDGISKASMRITVTMNLPERFDFGKMERCSRVAPLKITSDVTLRKGSDRVEVTTDIDNTFRDHRVRVLFPSNIDGDTYLSDSAYDVVGRPVALKEDNNIRRELEVETRPQILWTALGDGKSGLAVVSRGLPESAVIDRPDRPIALTLLRAFRRAVLSNDNPGGQIQGTHSFRYDIVPFDGGIPIIRLFHLGQRVNTPVRLIDIFPRDLLYSDQREKLPPEHSFLNVDGDIVVTSVQRLGGSMLVRLFNPHETTEKISLNPAVPYADVRCVTLDGRDDSKSTVLSRGEMTELLIPPKRIATIMFEME